ncbi:MAG: hypothetical protein M3Q29_10265 [Chloroflexota bacterium]|nr:hypothetical protein [Chloroflexota bacterium]
MSNSKELTSPIPCRAALTPEEQDTLIMDLASAYAVEYPQLDDTPGTLLPQPMEQMPVVHLG